MSGLISAAKGFDKCIGVNLRIGIELLAFHTLLRLPPKHERKGNKIFLILKLPSNTNAI